MMAPMMKMAPATVTEMSAIERSKLTGSSSTVDIGNVRSWDTTNESTNISLEIGQPKQTNPNKRDEVMNPV